MILARRKLENIDELILDAVTHIGATEGISAVTGRRVAAMCDISHFTCFHHFETTRNMLDAAAVRFERKYMRITTELFAKNMSWKDIWDTVLDRLIEDSDGTFFYDRYRTAFGFIPTMAHARAQELLEFNKIVVHADGFTDEQYMLLGDYVTALAFFYARRIIQKQLPNTPEVRAFIYKTVSSWQQEFNRSEHIRLNVK